MTRSAPSCGCRRRTGPDRASPTTPAPPTLVGTFRDGDLVDLRRVHTCARPDEILNPREWAGT